MSCAQTAVKEQEMAQTTMRGAVLQKDRSLVIEWLSVPHILPGSALVKVLAVQIAHFAPDVISGDDSFEVNTVRRC